jgi:hypothetical protein
MNKITLLLAALFVSILSTAQNSPGMRPELLLSKTVKVKPLTEGELNYQKGYDAFFEDDKMVNRYAANKSNRTRHDALANRYFKVTDIRPYDSQGIKNYLIQLQDTVKNESLYYKYTKLSESQNKYYFEVVGGLKYPDDFYCDYINENTDKATGEKKIIASITEGLHVVKIKKGKDVKYRLEAVTVEQVISMLRGVTLVLEDGRKFEKPDAEAVMLTRNDNIVYTATIELTTADVVMLTQSKVVSGKISKFEKKYTEGDKLQGMLKCLMKK